MGSLKLTPEMSVQARRGIGKERPARQHWNEITADTIRYFAMAVGDDNPRWYDPGYSADPPGGLVAPPTFLWTAFMSPMFFPSESPVRSKGGGFPGMQAIYAGAQFRFDRPIRPGDTFRSTSTRIGIVDPTDRVDGDSLADEDDVRSAAEAARAYHPDPDGPFVLQIERHECFDAKTGDRIGAMIDNSARIEPEAIEPSKGRWGSFTPRRYTTEEIEHIEGHYLTEAANRRGAVPRHLDEVRVGEKLPTLVKGPLTLLSLTAFFIGAPAFFNLTDRVLYNFTSRFPESVKRDPETNIAVVPEEMHWHPHMARQLSMPAGIDLGSQRIAWLAHLVTDWMGDHGELTELDVWFHRPMFLTETAWCNGTVAEALPGGRVRIELELTTFDGELLSTGSATVRLPTR
jgi:acyl dehydratase